MKLLKQKILTLLYFRQNYPLSKQPANFYKNNKVYLSYNFLYSLLPEYKAASIRKATKEMIEIGQMSKIIRGKKAFFLLTALGQAQLKIILKGFFEQQKIERGWWLAMIKPELTLKNSLRNLSLARRKKLFSSKLSQKREVEKSLASLGFKRFKPSFYLKPAGRDLRSKLESLASRVFLVYTNQLEFIDEKSFIYQFFQLDKEEKEMKNFITQIQKLLKKFSLKKSLSFKEKLLIAALYKKFFIIIKKTIRLPKNFLPKDWSLPLLTDLFQKLLLKVE